MILTRDKGSRMWGGGGVSGGSGGGGGLDPSALAGYASMGWVDDNYVSKDYFNQLFKVKVAVHVLVTDPSTTPATVISDTSTVRQDLLYPNEVPESTTTTDEETGYVMSTTYSIDSIQVMGGVWTNSYVSALGQNSSGGGGGGGGSLNEPLSSINMAGLSAPGAAQDGMTIVWDQATGRWKYGSAGAGSVTSVGMTVPTGFSVSPATITSTGTFAITFASGYSLPTTAKQLNWDTAYGWGNHATAGYALTSNVYSKTECDERFLTIAFFRSLFRAYTSGNTEVTPNAGDTATIDNIKAMFGFWTNAYISALGQNSSGGGGGGGSSTLAGLSDVALDPDPLTPANANDVLSYNGNGHWVNVSKSSFLSGYVTTSDISDMATKTWVTNQGYLTSSDISDMATKTWVGLQGYTTNVGTITSITAGTGLSGGTITDSGTIAIDSTYQTYISHGETAYGWGNHADAGYWKSGNHPTTLSGYGITDAVNSSTTWWGQSVSNGVVSGSLTNVGNITSNANGSIYSFSAIEFGTANNSGNGGALYFHFPGVFGHASSYIIEQSEGVLSLLGTPPTGGNFGVVVGSANGTYLQIGGIRLVYDSTNNALKVQKSDGTAGNFYATGGVSALGMSAGTSSVDAMTFNYVTINNRLRVKGSGSTHSIYGDSNGYLVLSGDEGIIFDNDTKINGYNLIITDGYVKSPKYYLDATRYLYVSSGTLYYYNGTTSKQVAFTN